jgi:hypothetical protein
LVNQLPLDFIHPLLLGQNVSQDHSVLPATELGIFVKGESRNLYLANLGRVQSLGFCHLGGTCLCSSRSLAIGGHELPIIVVEVWPVFLPLQRRKVYFGLLLVLVAVWGKREPPLKGVEVARQREPLGNEFKEVVILSLATH